MDSKEKGTRGASEALSEKLISPTRHKTEPSEKLLLKYKVTKEDQYEKVADVVSPFWKLPYSTQLKYKQEDTFTIIKKFGNKLSNINIDFPEDPSGLPCPIRPILPSPVTEEYRNKDEFSIGTGVDGNPKTVGFFVGSPSDLPSVTCVGPDELKICKKCHKEVVQAFQAFIRKSPLPACHEFHFKGFWKNIIVRTNRKNDMMVIVIAHPQNYSQDVIQKEKNSLRDYFTTGPGKQCNIHSLYFQKCPHTRCTHDQSPFELLFGEPFIFEEVDGLKFRISPESFFQVNVQVAAYLYSTVLQMVKASNHNAVLDIGCGTGTLTLTLASHLNNAYGIDFSSQAISDAKYNANLNGISNAKFFCGRAEELLQSLASEFYDSDLTAVMNPGRGGLSVSAIRAIRKYKHIKHLVYIACKPAGKSMDNFLQLCDDSLLKRTSGPPFRLLLASPLDMFPHTRHFELVLFFAR